MYKQWIAAILNQPVTKMAMMIPANQPRRRRQRNEAVSSHLFSRYRFTREGILFIVALVSEDIKRATKRGGALSPVMMVLVTLRYLATGAFLSVVGDTFGIHKCTVSRVITTVMKALVRHADRFIRWPTPEDKPTIKEAFYRQGGFPNCIGCVDRTIYMYIVKSNNI